MRLAIACAECTKRLTEWVAPLNFQHVEVRDDNCYEVTCVQGHKSTILLQQQKFEVLFDIGANAIIDGYYRDAVSSFTSSMERFFEFATHAFILRDTKSDEVFTECWKLVSSQSERQLGSFIFQWASHYGEKPQLLDRGSTEFRNEVIHKGKIPLREEAEKYGQSVLDVVRPKLRRLKNDFSEEIVNLTHDHLSRVNSKTSASLVTTLSIPTIVSINIEEPSFQQMLLAEHLSELREQRKRLGA